MSKLFFSLFLIAGVKKSLIVYFGPGDDLNARSKSVRRKSSNTVPLDLTPAFVALAKKYLTEWWHLDPTQYPGM